MINTFKYHILNDILYNEWMLKFRPYITYTCTLEKVFINLLNYYYI